MHQNFPCLSPPLNFAVKIIYLGQKKLVAIFCLEYEIFRNACTVYFTMLWGINKNGGVRGSNAAHTPVVEQIANLPYLGLWHARQTSLLRPAWSVGILIAPEAPVSWHARHPSRPAMGCGTRLTHRQDETGIPVDRERRWANL